MKTFRLLALAALFASTLASCEDPMEEFAPIVEEPTITSTTGDGPDKPCPTGCQ